MQTERELEAAFRRIEERISRLEGRTDERPVRHPKPTGTGGGSSTYGVVRGWDDPALSVVNVTIVSRKVVAEVPVLFLQANETQKIETDGLVRADSYEPFKFVGDSEVYPFDLLPGMVPLPILTISGNRFIMHHSKIFYGSVPPGAPITEGILVNGKGELGFAS